MHTAAHEAAHVIQQRSGIALTGGIGKAGDQFEQKADAVADLVVRGESAEALLGDVSTARAPGGQIQRKERIKAEAPKKPAPSPRALSANKDVRAAQSACRAFASRIEGALDSRRDNWIGPKKVDIVGTASRLAKEVAPKLADIHRVYGDVIAQHSEALGKDLEQLSFQVARLVRWERSMSDATLPKELAALVDAANALNGAGKVPAVTNIARPSTQETKQISDNLKKLKRAYSKLFTVQSEAVNRLIESKAPAKNLGLVESIIWQGVELAVASIIGGVGGAITVALESAVSNTADRRVTKIIASGLKDAGKTALKSAIGAARSGNDAVGAQAYFQGVRLTLDTLADTGTELSEAHALELEHSVDPLGAIHALRTVVEAQTEKALELQTAITLGGWMKLVTGADLSGSVVPNDSDGPIDFDRLGNRYPRCMLHLTVDSKTLDGPITIKRCSIKGLPARFRKSLSGLRVGDLGVAMRITGSENEGIEILCNDRRTLWTDARDSLGTTDRARAALSKLAGERQPTDRSVVAGARVVLDRLENARLPKRIEAIS